ncbi:hypothetical protein DPMN_007070 [Dreissena polymorpha]|uniref:Uncharacterized protein n=1 Tax=Dreissena polymorpha TaxID=45954 RepID=A0A9D4MVU3_DREPO|nr:hypothetical protein DPMN_007070 [Dreissena polymorpha]
MSFYSRKYTLHKDASDHEWTAYKSCLVPCMDLVSDIMFFSNLLSSSNNHEHAQTATTDVLLVCDEQSCDFLISVTVVLGVPWHLAI